MRSAVARAVAPRPPGPPPADHALRVDRARLDRATATLALVGHAPQRAIAACLEELSQVHTSLGYVDGGLARAGAAAAALQAEWPLRLPAGDVAANELFVGDQPQLVAVDPDSPLILALEHPLGGRVDGPAWQQVLTGIQARVQDRGGALRRLASDGGKALATAVAHLPGVDHQLDRWHALRHVGRAARALERAAYAALGRERALEKKARGVGRKPSPPGMDRAHPMGGYGATSGSATRPPGSRRRRRSGSTTTRRPGPPGGLGPRGAGGDGAGPGAGSRPSRRSAPGARRARPAPRRVNWYPISPRP